MDRKIEEAVRIQKALKNGTHFNKFGNQVTIKSLNRKEEHFCARKRHWDTSDN